jgi:hypothetical protein
MLLLLLLPAARGLGKKAYLGAVSDCGGSEIAGIGLRLLKRMDEEGGNRKQE